MESSRQEPVFETIEMLIEARPRDLGGFHVRRLLPYVKRRMVGPFIFFDHMGPAVFAPGSGVDVRPHPHIGLATVTYLFEGSFLHQDSLGSHQLIQPGAINWMTAGRGIVHSERTPQDLREQGSVLHGIQCWVALPDGHEETEPSFRHHPSDTIPSFQIGEARVRLLVGTAFGHKSPVLAHSDLFYLEVDLPCGVSLTLPNEGREAAAYAVRGKIRIEAHTLDECTLAVGREGCDLKVEALEDAKIMLFGGVAFDRPREVWWNFVSSSKERIERAKELWSEGRFPRIPGDDQEFIPLPEEPGVGVKRNPSGTIM